MNILPMSGFTGCLAKAGLDEGSNSATIKIAAPNGAGIDFAIDGKCYHKADTDNIAITAHAAQADLTTCLYLVQINSSGTISTKKGKEVLTADLPHKDSLQWPLPDTDKCPVGGYKIKTSGGTYTNGTTDIASASAADFFDFACGMPSDPETTTAS